MKTFFFHAFPAPFSPDSGSPLPPASAGTTTKTGGPKNGGGGGAVLPAYCDPPNPCPIGYDAKDGCIEDFENTSEFSRNYQARQNCLCDSEHMFNCPMEEQGAPAGGKINDVSFACGWGG